MLSLMPVHAGSRDGETTTAAQQHKKAKTTTAAQQHKRGKNLTRIDVFVLPQGHVLQVGF